MLRALQARVLPSLRLDDGGAAAGGDPADPIPTRLVEGFLPGDRVGNVETVRNHSAHAWVEVYFPAMAGCRSTPRAPGSASRSVTAP